MKYLSIIISLVTIVACGLSVEKTPTGTMSGITDEEKVSKTSADIVVGAVNWQNVLNISPTSEVKRNSKAVGLLSLPAKNSRCTAFSISNDLIMTNHHCVANQSEVQGAKYYPNFESGRSFGYGYSCPQLVVADQSLDLAILRCSGTPGVNGIVDLEANTNGGFYGEEVYIIHQNCDYYLDKSCSPTKKYSPGKSLGEEYSGYTKNIFYDADTLGGSSGSPVFHAGTNKVIALHHHGLGNQGYGRGSSNAGVSMGQIVEFLRANVVGLSNVGGEKSGQSTLPDLPTSRPEPDSISTTVFGNILNSNDVDILELTVRELRPINIKLFYNIVDGDLDLYVLDSHFRELAKSISQSSEEEIGGSIYPGKYYIVVQGYLGGTGEYMLDFN